MAIPGEIQDMITGAAADRLRMQVHALVRPGWTCEVDGELWPCTTRRAELVAAYPKRELAALMRGYLHTAFADLPHADADEVTAQLVGWVR